MKRQGFFINCWTCSLHQTANAGVQSYLVSLRPSAQPTLAQDMGELVGTQTPCPENLINGVHEADLPALGPLDPMRCATDFSWLGEV